MNKINKRLNRMANNEIVKIMNEIKEYFNKDKILTLNVEYSNDLYIGHINFNSNLDNYIKIEYHPMNIQQSIVDYIKNKFNGYNINFNNNQTIFWVR